MILRQIARPETGCTSYLVGDSAAGVCAIIDPTNDVEKFLDESKQLRLRIERVIETHTHADHLSGAKALARQLNVPLHLPSRTRARFPHESISDNARLRVGDIEIQALQTPGHTPDHMSFIVGEAAIVGDSLLVGTVGRADFYDKGPAEMFHTMFDRILRLHDDVVVYPAHFGPLHGLPQDRFTTIGHERRFNEALTQSTKENFVRYMREGWPPKPHNWETIVERNLRS